MLRDHPHDSVAGTPPLLSPLPRTARGGLGPLSDSATSSDEEGADPGPSPRRTPAASANHAQEPRLDPEQQLQTE